MFDPAPSTLALADWCGRLGQDLFEPPNVGGWPGGKAWISARTLISRANYVAAWLDGPSAGRPTPFNAEGFMKRHGFSDPIACFAPLLLARPTTVRGEGRTLVATLLTSPEAQLG